MLSAVKPLASIGLIAYQHGMGRVIRKLRRIAQGSQATRLKFLIAAKGDQPVRLHLGCGDRHFEGWINVDFDATGNLLPDVLIDLSKGLPAEDNSVDRIYSEDFIEHIDRKAGERLLRDCLRCLKPGGVMRLLTPNLKLFVQKYVDREESSLQWYREQFGCETFGEMLNAGMREWGHKMVYDDETLIRLLDMIGFDVRETRYNCSEFDDLVGRDSRNTAEGSLSMYYDCVKPTGH